MSDYLQLIIGILLSYFIGSIPTAVWLGRFFYSIDVREHGSKNAGATNTIRILGYKAGIPVLIFDMAKGWLPVFTVTHFLIWNTSNMLYFQIAFGLAAVMGHVYSVFIGFKGGKGVATFAGMALGLFPIAFLFSLGIFLVSVAWSRYVSLGSIIAAIAFPLFLIFDAGNQNLPLIFIGIFASIFIIYTHRGNVKKILNGTENKFGTKK